MALGNPAAGAIVSVAWAVLLTSYRQLNRAKFGVLQEMEKELPARRSCARSVLAPFATSRNTFLHPALVSWRT
jgi:hypothetical protein